MIRTIRPLDQPDPGLERVATASGFSLHTSMSCEGLQKDKRERLCRHIDRPAVAVPRLSLSSTGKVVYTLKTPYRDGTRVYTAGQKTREIGVRKVLGASVADIVLLLLKEFTKLIPIVLGIAIPLAYFSLNWWLEYFAYRITINPLSFVIAGVIAVFIGLITVSFQSFKAAIMNPIRSLRTE